MADRPIALLSQLKALWQNVEALQEGGGGPQGPHSHTIANVTGLQSELDGKQPVGSYALTAHNHDGDYQPLGDYAASIHGHVIADVSGLQAALDGKQASGSYQPAGSYAAEAHAHNIGDVTGLQTALDGKQASGSYASASHNHDATYAPLSHNHTIGNVTGLQTALDGKQTSGSYALSSHNHDGVYALADHTHQGGGSDPWTVIRLASDFTTTSGTAVAVTGLSFTPAANKQYEFEAKLRLRSATATIGPRPGLTWPTGTTDGGVGIWAPNSATAEAIARQPAGVSAVAASTGVPSTTQSWPGFISGEVQTGGSPSGNVQVTLNAETAGTTVTMKAGSFLRYREIA